MSKSALNALVIGFLVCSGVQTLKATGDYGPAPAWLENGGLAIDQAPEFFWEDILRTMAKEFTPSETRADADIAACDHAEFEEAITKGYLKPANAAAATKAHDEARKLLQPDPNEPPSAAAPEIVGPEEFDSEFADYHRGAFALRSKKFDEAETAWKKLLARPKTERHFRSVWAAFMLGKRGLATGAPDTSMRFEQCRALAKEGFADSIGLAADSYGWQAKVELEAGHIEQAARLYLTQLALGDDTALISLKAVIPDRGLIWGTLSFDSDGKAVPSDDGNAPVPDNKPDPASDAKLITSAQSPILRRLQTAHVLATETTQSWSYDYAEGGDKKTMSRSERWLAAVKAAKVKVVNDADRLAWVAYTAGDYDSSRDWLKLCKDKTGLSRWLEAKLLRRDGNLPEAIAAMRDSVALLEKGGEAGLTTARADLAVLHLASADFLNALDQFAHTGLVSDMAYVAERLVSADELKVYVDAQFPEVSKKLSDEEEFSGTDRNAGRYLRDLLGRRLVREDRYTEARLYLRPERLPVFDDYVTALKKADETKLPKKERARAWFHAAVLLTEHGGEFMGTIGEPDNVGHYQTLTTLEREQGKLMERGPNNKFVDAENRKPLTFHVPVTKEEKARLAKYKITPFRPDHYRYVALALVWKAAALLPDHCDELADILNTAGNWMKGDYRGDDEAADKFFQAIERRASRTRLGKEAGAKHWFVESYGPWSEAPKEQ